MTSRLADGWTSAESYDLYVGRWSRVVAGEFLAWLEVPPAARWLDVGCGTGVLSELILERALPAAITGIDPSERFVRHARERIADGRVRFDVGDAQELPLATGTFDATVAGLVLNFVPAPNRAACEMVRVTRDSGIVAAYVWDYAGEMQLMRHFWNAAVEFDASASELDEGRRFAIAKPEPLTRLLQGAGLAEVEVQAVDVPTVFRDFDDYWKPFLRGQGPAGAYAVSLDEERQAALRERLRAALPSGPDGSISLTARAWAVRGRK